MVSRDFRRMVDGYGLTTANILYHLPDYPAIVQSYIWLGFKFEVQLRLTG